MNKNLFFVDFSRPDENEYFITAMYKQDMCEINYIVSRLIEAEMYRVIFSLLLFILNNDMFRGYEIPEIFLRNLKIFLNDDFSILLLYTLTRTDIPQYNLTRFKKYYNFSPHIIDTVLLMLVKEDLMTEISIIKFVFR